MKKKYTCGNCKAEVKDSHKYCIDCGCKLQPVQDKFLNHAQLQWVANYIAEKVERGATAVGIKEIVTAYNKHNRDKIELDWEAEYDIKSLLQNLMKMLVKEEGIKKKVVKKKEQLVLV